jgi:predicted RNase H-like HicB family nuclease
MLIEWSDADQAYIVTLPEWERVGALAHTHGVTYAEAAQKGQELIVFLFEAAQQDGDRIPTPAGFDTHAYAPGETAEYFAAESERLANEIEKRPAPHV